MSHPRSRDGPRR